jgi:hypothetical protein
MTETFTIVNSQPSMVEALAVVQCAAFSTLAEDEIITAAQYAAHIARFPGGQFAVLNAAGLVVACSTDFRTSVVDFNAFEHRYIDAVANNWLSRHDPQGEWLYGADIGVLPAYRRRGLARRRYGARRHLIRRLNLRGPVAGGLLTVIPPEASSMAMTTREHDVWTGIFVPNSTSGPQHCGRSA